MYGMPQGRLGRAWARARGIPVRQAAPATAGTAHRPLPTREVDVAIVAETTYPYLRGGVSAVIHDIVVTNPDIDFGIIHITWDSASPHTDLYEPPENVRWVHPVYLSMHEHVEDFLQVKVGELRADARGRREIATRLLDAVQAVLDGKMDEMWAFYDEAVNPRTRRYNIWPILGTQEFMLVARQRLASLDLTFSELFWQLREFFSLAFAVAGPEYPRARVYHAHTTGYAALLGALAARQNGGRFLLTEHNLYVRDTVNQLLDRSMALPIKANDWREMTGITPTERLWTAWWIELSRLAYDKSALLTYLYPGALGEAADLGAPIERSVIVPNGMVTASFAQIAAKREAAGDEVERPGHVWRLCYIARIVPIKGLLDLIEVVGVLRQRDMPPFAIDILGPDAERPDYKADCEAKIAELGVGDVITFLGSVNVKEHLEDYDFLVLPSHNEGQPMVVLEAMSAGIPVLGTDVGGMSQLVTETLYKDGVAYGPCGHLVPPHDITGMATMIEGAVRDASGYHVLAALARLRATTFFQLHDAMHEYNNLYRELGELRLPLQDDAIDIAAVEAREGAEQAREVSLELEQDAAPRDRGGAAP